MSINTLGIHLPKNIKPEEVVIAGCASHPCEKPINGKHKGGCNNCAFSRVSEQHAKDLSQITTNQQYGCKLGNAEGLFQDQKGKVFLKIGNGFFPKEENPNEYQAVAQLNTQDFLASI